MENKSNPSPSVKAVKLPAPKFTQADMDVMQRYFGFNQKYHAEINKALTADLELHPVWAPLIKQIPAEQREEQNLRSLDMQRAAIFEGKWEGYTTDLMSQGVTYARMNIAYSEWYELIKMYKNYLLPYIKKDFEGSTEDAIMILDGFSKFTDYAMYGIAEAYFQEKNNMIRAGEERFRAIFENADAHIFLIDKNATISMINHVAKGYAKENVVGKSIYDFQPAENIPAIRKAINTVFEQKISSTYDTVSERGNEKNYYFNSVSPVLEEGGAVNTAVVISRDITKQKIAEAEVLELNRDLEKKVAERTEELNTTNKELESFSYSVSHDLRSPLRAINGFTQILVEELSHITTEDVKDAMESIIVNAKKMGELIDNLLEFSRLGKQELSKRTLNMNELVDQIIDELGYREQKHITFNVKDLPVLNGDRPMIRQVMINLVSNAVKYSGKKDNPVIEIGSYNDHNTPVYYVKDNGAGFDMAFYDKLFGVFQRLHHTREFEGTGVGLAIVNRIIAKHGGRLWAEGNINEGAVFYFTVPNQ